MAGVSVGEDAENPVAINVTALVDIIFCLCVFFMISFKFKQIEGKFDTWLSKSKGLVPMTTEELPKEIRIAMFWDERADRVNRQLGIRKSALNATRDVALSFLGKGLQTIVFAPSRLATEVLVTYLKEALETKPGSEGVIRGYRGGYLPLKRREIERGLREGSVLGVVSTNALELGIDIGSLDVAVLMGYPGSVASSWQQAGRAGRRSGTSVAVMVANSSPLNQFIAKNPDYFFGAPVEQARVNPDNLQILVNHIKCAAFELPFVGDEPFGGENLVEILKFLEDEKLLHRAGDRWHWTSDSYPADAISLRSVSSDNFVVQDVTREPRIIAEVDYDSAPSMVHEKAIYILEGRTYYVERYDHKERRAEVREAEVDYYTDAITYTKVRILERFACEARGHGRRNHGEVHVTSQVVGFKKIKFHTGENVGAGELTMPENEMHTTAWWLTVPRELMSALPFTLEQRRDGIVALSYTLGQLAALFLMCDRHDLGVAIGRRFRAPVLVISQDVFPEIATELHRLRNPAVVGILGTLVGAYLRRADRIVAIGETMRERLEAKGAPAERLRVIPNWVDTRAITPQPRDNPWAERHGLVSRFVVMHSGNVGHAQDLDSLVRAATFLRDRDDIRIVIAGFGARHAEMVELAARLDVEDMVRFLPYQERDRLPFSLSSADVHVVGLARGLAGYVVPSRLYGILSAGRPVIAAAEDTSETARLVREVGCGIVIPPARPDLLARTIRAAAEGDHDLAEIGRRGRAYVEREADRLVAMERYRALIRELLASPPLVERTVLVA